MRCGTSLRKSTTGFNGAALSRARKEWKARWWAGQRGKLQRGRALTSAEGEVDSFCSHVALEASTGPRSHERGRSRGQPRDCPASVRFNGAALSRARKEPVTTATSQPRKRLQRGRALTSAEGASTQSEHHPSHRGFNGAALSRARKECAALTMRGPDTGLQRGRALTSAEGDARSSNESSHPPASTGPRSHERGRTERERADQQRVGASTGPRSHERGRPTPPPADAPTTPASTGPRSHERGRAPCG